MAEIVQVQRREGSLGTAASRRLRKEGNVPAVLYGHKQENEHLFIDQRTIESILRHHSKIVELQGAVKDTALVSDLQFDPLGIEVLHVDLQRVDMNERVQVSVAIQFKGDPAGAKQGGIVIENAHDVEIECPAVAIPESLVLNITSVNAGEHRSAGDIPLPDGVSLITAADTVVYHIEKPKGAAASDAGEESTEE
ncbi:MAG: 50S ribosomal protein L25 [Planctomycetota bacterium]